MIFLFLIHLFASANIVEWKNVPKKLFVNQIFPVTIQFVFPKKAYIKFIPSGGKNLQLIYDKTPLQHDDLYYYKTLYFKITDTQARLPDVLIEAGMVSYTLPGIPIQASRLNPPKDFCHVLAKTLVLIKHEEVQYNKNFNLVVMKLMSQMGNLEDFHLPFTSKEELKEIKHDFPKTTAIYYAILPASISELHFSYFDTDTREFKTLRMPIKVKDETVSTQSDIKPSVDKHRFTKLILFSLVAGTLLLIGILKRNFFLFLLGVLVAIYVWYNFKPLQKVCLKKGAKIYILPTSNSTIFDISKSSKNYLKLNEANGYTKIQLSKEKIGWVKDEDICKN